MLRINARTINRAYTRIVDDIFPGVARRLRVGRFGYKLTLPRGRERPSADDFSIAIPFEYSVPQSVREQRIAIVSHIFHPDLAVWLFEVLAHLDLAADIFISTDTPEKQNIIESAFSGWKFGSTCVRVMENRGRDIAPKLVGFADVYSRYDLILFLHSKKSAHHGFGADWRDYLVRSLAGSSANVNSILEIFRQCPEIGMVFPQHFSKLSAATPIEWGSNFRLARRLAWQMDIDLSPDGYLDMPSGSMFWSRPQALRPLLALNLKTQDFPAEPCPVDGTIAHEL